jgi:hypothetical protein
VSGADRPAGLRSRGSVLAELLFLIGLALLAYFWIIPSQVSGGDAKARQKAGIEPEAAA